MTELTLALDIGGTKIAAGLVTPAGELARSATMATPRGDGEQVWQVVEKLIADTTAGSVVRGVGIACAWTDRRPGGHRQPDQHPRLE